MRRFPSLWVVGWLLVTVGCAHAPGPAVKGDGTAPLRARVVDYGRYRAIRPGALVAQPETTTGRAHSAPILQLIERTDRIPIAPGSYFGFKVRIEPLPDRHWIDLQRVVVHPEMVLPDGSRSTGYRVAERKQVSGGVAFAIAGYALDEPYEQVAGEWRFQYWHDGELLVEQRFTTYWPAGAERRATDPDGARREADPRR